MSLCLAAITEPEAAEVHFARRNLRPSQHVLGRIAKHPVEDVFLLPRRLRKDGGERRQRALPPRHARATRPHGAGDAYPLRITDVIPQLKARGESLNELVRHAIVVQLLPAVGWSPNDEL